MNRTIFIGMNHNAIILNLVAKHVASVTKDYLDAVAAHASQQAGSEVWEKTASSMDGVGSWSSNPYRPDCSGKRVETLTKEYNEALALQKYANHLVTDSDSLVEMAENVIDGIDNWNQAVAEIVDVSHMPKWAGLEALRAKVKEFRQYGH